MKSTVPAKRDFPQLVKSCHQMVWRYLRLLGCEAALAEDLTQETFLTVFQRPPEDLGEHATGAYLRRVANSRFIDAMRKAGRTVPLDLHEAETVWSATMESGTGPNNAWHDALEECLSRVSVRARRVLDLRYRDQLPIRTVAEQTGMQESGVKTMLGRVKGRLRECIENRVNDRD